MTPLDHSDRQKGREAMEESLTPEGRAVRRLNSGRPKKGDVYERLTPLQVVYRLFSEIERAHRVLKNEEVDRDFLTWSIQFYVPANKGQAAYVDKVKPATDGPFHCTTKDAIDILTKLDGINNPIFTHIIWGLPGKAAWGDDKPQPGYTWVTRLIPFVEWKPGDDAMTPTEKIKLIEEELKKQK